MKTGLKAIAAALLLFSLAPSFASGQTKTVSLGGRVTDAAGGETSDSSTCFVSDFLGKNRATYIISSTAYNINASNGNIQYFGLISTFTKTYPEGRLHGTFSNFRSSYEVRCIKNQQ